MKLILIRHAETDGNKTRYVGREDLDLNAVGRQQAASLAAALAHEPIDIIFSSPLSRAVATARPLAEARGLETELRHGLVEIDYGRLQGNAKGDKPFKLRREYRDTPMPGGESLMDVWQRLMPVAAELGGLMLRGATPAIVGHYWSNRMLAAMLAGADFDTSLAADGYKPANASAYAFAFTGGGAPRIAQGEWLHHGSGDAGALGDFTHTSG